MTRSGMTQRPVPGTARPHHHFVVPPPPQAGED